MSTTQQANWDTCLEHAAQSDVGLRRTNNQDSFTVMLATTPEMWQRRGHLSMVADGMGAHAAGEYASKLAVDNIPLTFHKEPDREPSTALRKAIEDANHVIHVRGQANVEFAGMGTTCSALVLAPEGALVGHVGDSRVYRLRGNRLEQLSFDHSLVWELAANGQLGDDDMAGYNIPKNIITRSLGPNPDVKVDLEGPFPLVVGDTFLLCSDGLTGQVKNEEIAAVLGSLNPEQATHALIDLANLRGGPDNITVIVVRVTGADISRTGTYSQSVEVNAPPTGGGPSFTAKLVFAIVLLAMLASSLGLYSHFKLPGPALLGVIATIVVGVIGLVVLSKQTGAGGGRRSGEPFGRAPYATAIFAANAGFIEELSRVLEQLRKAAQEENWVVDWTRINEATEKATAATSSHDYVVAVREFCLAISDFMDGLRHQRKAR